MTVILPLLSGLLAGVVLSQVLLGAWLLHWDGQQWRAARARIVRGEIRAPGLGSWPLGSATRVAGNLYVVAAEPLVWVDEQQLARARRSLILADLFRSRRIDIAQIAAIAAALVSLYLAVRLSELAGQLDLLRADLAVVRDVLSKPLVVQP